MQRTLLIVLAMFLIAAAPSDPKPVSFRSEVAPILVRKCLGCHNAYKASNGLNMSTFALLRKGGKTSGDLILEPGDPDGSQLIEVVRPGGPRRMPLKLPPLSSDEIGTLERWVKQGAKFDGPSEGETPIISLVDPLRDLPRVALQVPAADPVPSLAYSPDAKILAAAIGRQVVLFDLATGKPLGTLGDHPGPVTSVRITPDGKTLIASGGRSGLFGSVTIWDMEKRTRRFELRGHRDGILASAIAPDGATLATAGYDRQILIWDIATGKVLRTLTDHTDAVYAVAFAPDGKRLASAGADRTVKLWDLASGRRLRTLSDSTAELYAVAFGPSGETVLAGGVDRSIRSWRVSDSDASLVNSVFAHDAAILRLVVSADGKTLLSSGEDKDVKVWDLATLQARTALEDQPDWPQALAISTDGSRIAVGRFDGSLAVYDAATGKVALTLRSASEPPPPVKPELVRNATLNPPSPRGAARGSKLRVTLTGTGVGQAASVALSEPGLTATIVHSEKPEPNRLDIDLTVAADARVGLHSLGVITPLGIPATQSFVVSAHPERAEAEPNDDPSQATTVPFPATLVGTIDRPGDVDHFKFPAKAGQPLVVEVVAKALSSSILAVVTLLDDRGQIVATANASDGRDPVLTATIPRDGVVTLRVADADYSGSGAHFYRIAVAAAPYLTSVAPLGVERGQTATLQVAGLNLQGVRSVSLPVAADAEPGTIVEVPVALPDGSRSVNHRTVVVADGRQRIEAEGNDEPARAEPIEVPGGVSGRIGRDGDVDHFRFEAKKGKRLIVEVFGRRLGTAIDPVIEVLDGQGRPVPRVLLRPVRATELTFRDHDSTTPGIRLSQWNNLAMNDMMLIGRELTRILALPKNPDDDCTFWSEQKQRLGLLETTPEQHPNGQSAYKVEVHPPGTTFPPGGVAPVTLTYRNDDGGPGFAKDSRVTFDPPADGPYIVRVEDVRGLGGDSFGYHLVVRAARPDFRLTLSPENVNIPRGGTALLTASLARLDGFDGAVDVMVEGLPPGVSATPARIEKGDFTASLVMLADASAAAFSAPTWKAVGIAEVGGPSESPGQALRHEIDPGGPSGGWVTVTPTANLKIVATPASVVIRPGEQVAMTLAVERGPAFSGRVPIEVRNLPLGVRVLNIGLNGVLVTEAQKERTIFLYAEPWVEKMERPFYAVGKAEAAATEDSSPPIELIVKPVATGPRQTTASVGSR